MLPPRGSRHEHELAGLGAGVGQRETPAHRARGQIIIVDGDVFVLVARGHQAILEQRRRFLGPPSAVPQGRRHGRPQHDTDYGVRLLLRK